MKIVYTTIEDFIKQEVEEHGWDYVEAQFALGYEPCLIDGSFFAWVKVGDLNAAFNTTSTSDNSVGVLSSNCVYMVTS